MTISTQLNNSLATLGSVGVQIAGILNNLADPAVPNQFLGIGVSGNVVFSGTAQILSFSDSRHITFGPSSRARGLLLKAYEVTPDPSRPTAGARNPENNRTNRRGVITGTNITDCTIGFFDAVPVYKSKVGFLIADELDILAAHTALTSAAIDNAAMADITVPAGALTRVNVGATNSTDASAAIRTNFKYTSEELNNIRADLLATKKLLNSIIDDMQAYGLFQ